MAKLVQASPNPTKIESRPYPATTASSTAVGIRAHSLLSGADVRKITLRGMRGGLQGTGPLPAAVGLAGVAASK
jgi:hypothetical protein